MTYRSDPFAELLGIAVGLAVAGAVIALVLLANWWAGI